VGGVTFAIVEIVPSPASDTAAAPDEGRFMHELATRLFPICRSLTGDGVRQTLAIIGEYLPSLEIHEVPSGTQVLDWTVPDEWNIRGAYVEGPSGERIIDFDSCNVHVVGYSAPVDVHLSLEDLQPHLHSDAEHRTAIPYVTSYYNRAWGFCLTQDQRETLVEGQYHAVIDSTLEPGSLTYGELVVPGETTDEVFVTTYVCHPSLANNELSGPMVTTALARWLSSLPSRRYTYRIVFAPETIGAITYISRNLEHLRQHVVAAFNLTCIGDDGDYSFMPSRLGDTPIDRIGRRIVAARPRPVFYSYLDRGSDERQYCMPGVDLPMISLMRTKYGSYPQYHTSLDDLTFVTPTGLQGGLDLVRDCITEFEHTDYYRATVLGEPQLGRRGLYHAIHARTVADVVLLRTHVLAYSDGQHSAADIAEVVGLPESDVLEIVDELVEHGLLEPTAPRKER
jgi:aminopeptidase-like protein